MYRLFFRPDAYLELSTGNNEDVPAVVGGIPARIVRIIDRIKYWDIQGD
jgi:hypothetical protein